jgi:universal stress protein E
MFMTRILVVVDPESEQHPALDRVAELDPGFDVDFHVVSYVESAPTLARDARGLAATLGHRNQWVENLVAPLREKDYCVTSEVVSFTRLYESILQTVVEVGADVVFKPYRQHSALQRTFSTPTDWRLIRYCPVPLLLIGDQESIRGKPVVAALDLSDSDRAHDELNRVVIAQAKVLAAILQSEIRYVYAYAPRNAAVTVSGGLAYEMAEDAYGLLVADAQELVAKHGVLAEDIHFIEGVAANVITDYARVIDASTVVLGTVARSGASGLLIGNTAESVVEQTSNDLLVVKHKGFRSPLV